MLKLFLNSSSMKNRKIPDFALYQARARFLIVLGFSKLVDKFKYTLSTWFSFKFDQKRIVQKTGFIQV